MDKGKLYGIGVGPGDPELVTLKAVRLIRKCDIIAVPHKDKSRCFALRIAMTLAAEEAFRKADLIVGAKRLTESLARFHKPSENAILAQDIAQIARNSPQRNIAIAMGETECAAVITELTDSVTHTKRGDGCQNGNVYGSYVHD